MWFEKRRKPVANITEEPEHWPTERMIEEGHADYATPEDLEGLPDNLLSDIAVLCEVDQYAAPDECVPCLALTMILDRRAAERERLENMAPTPVEDDEERETPKLDALMKETPSFEESEAVGSIPVEVSRRPYVEILQLQLAAMQNTLEEIVNGPPIPPKDVSLEELALLVVAADRWIKMTEAQGVELATNQQQVLDVTRDLVARLRS